MYIEMCGMVTAILFLLNLKKKKIIVEDFLLVSMGQMHSRHLGFFWLWSDR